jgi:hypothetical protein
MNNLLFPAAAPEQGTGQNTVHTTTKLRLIALHTALVSTALWHKLIMVIL